VAVAIALIAGIARAAAADTGQACEVIPMPCTFEAQPFKLRVIDAETQKPLADVHALAEWRMEGAGGRANGPLMVKDALSDADGQVSFDGWGPIQGPWTGLVIGSDPVVTLFKSGYKSALLNNGYLPPSRERERIRRFVRRDVTYALEPFRGTPEEWVKELDRIYAGRAFPRSDDQSLQFRDQYLNRLRRVWIERQSVSARTERDLFWFIERAMRFLEEGHR